MTEVTVDERGALRVASLHDPETGSFQYVVIDRATNAAAIIDPVLDYDRKAGALTTRNMDVLLSFVAMERLRVEWVLDTHPHADHFSAVARLGELLGARTGIGARVVEVQALWRDIYCLDDLRVDGSQWDHLFADGETFRIGELEARVLLSPGHTLASVSYLVGDAAFVHDTLMMPDAGTSRADFPGGDAAKLYGSIRAILTLPPETATYVGHDYGHDGRAITGVVTVAEHREHNIHIHDGIDQAAFIAMRQARDATLPLPDLMLAALQVNIRGGRLPDPEPCGHVFLRIPLGRFSPS